MRIPLNDPPTPSTLFGVPDSNARFGRHAGIDYPVGVGTPVFACISGDLTTISNDQYHGNVVDIKNGDKWYRVMHLREFTQTGGHVEEGTLVGYSGNTGLSTGPHLHWDVRTQYVPTSFAAFIDPLTLLEGDVPMPNDGDIINAKRAATQVPDYQPTGPELDYYKAPEHGYHDLMYDTINGMQAEIDNRNKQINDLKAQAGDDTEANLLGKALIKLLATFGYKKG